VTEQLPITYSIVGVQKAATSTLSSILRGHPEVARADRKEMHFFDDEARDWSAPDYTAYGAPKVGERQRLAGDATPIYLFWPRAIERMRAYSPDMRLIASFRDPVERAFSQWMMKVDRGGLLPDFDELVSAGLDVEDPAAPPWHAGWMRGRAVVARGFYGRQLREGLRHFPREQWLLVDFVDVVTQPEQVRDRLTDHLGLHRFHRPHDNRVRHRTKPISGRPGPSAAVLERMAAAFADDLAEFERLSGIDVSRWATRRMLTGELDPVDLAAKLGAKARGE
jgi:hypothetical protein